MNKYPFTPDLLRELPDELVQLFQELEETLLIEICSRLNLSDQLNEVSVQAIRALRSHGIDLNDIEKAIQRATQMSEEKLNNLIDDVVAQNQTYYTELIDFAAITQPEFIVDAADIEAIRKQTLGELRNITQSMGFLVDNGRTKLKYADAYQWALDSAALKVQSGAISYNQAIRGAIKELADSGLKATDYDTGRGDYVQYASGHRDHVDVAVRRAVMTGISQVCQQYANRSMEILGTDLVEVTAHLGARNKDGINVWTNHERWQGKIYHWPNASNYFKAQQGATA